MTPIERYAMRFIEETEAQWSAEQLAAAEREIEEQKNQWERKRLEAMQEEEERRTREIEEENELLTYSREDATNQVSNKTKRSIFYVKDKENGEQVINVNDKQIKRSLNQQFRGRGKRGRPSLSRRLANSRSISKNDDLNLTNEETSDSKMSVESTYSESDSETEEDNTDDANYSSVSNYVDSNSPRTRSSGSVAINLWTLDVSPILPGVKPVKSNSTSLSAKKKLEQNVDDPDKIKKSKLDGTIECNESEVVTIKKRGRKPKNFNSIKKEHFDETYTKLNKNNGSKIPIESDDLSETSDNSCHLKVGEDAILESLKDTVGVLHLCNIDDIMEDQDISLNLAKVKGKLKTAIEKAEKFKDEKLSCDISTKLENKQIQSSPNYVHKETEDLLHLTAKDSTLVKTNMSVINNCKENKTFKNNLDILKIVEREMLHKENLREREIKQDEQFKDTFNKNVTTEANECEENYTNCVLWDERKIEGSSKVDIADNIKDKAVCNNQLKEPILCKNHYKKTDLESTKICEDKMKGRNTSKNYVLHSDEESDSLLVNINHTKDASTDCRKDGLFQFVGVCERSSELNETQQSFKDVLKSSNNKDIIKNISCGSEVGELCSTSDNSRTIEDINIKKDNVPKPIEDLQDANKSGQCMVDKNSEKNFGHESENGELNVKDKKILKVVLTSLPKYEFEKYYHKNRNVSTSVDLVNSILSSKTPSNLKLSLHKNQIREKTDLATKPSDVDQLCLHSLGVSKSCKIEKNCTKSPKIKKSSSNPQNTLDSWVMKSSKAMPSLEDEDTNKSSDIASPNVLSSSSQYEDCVREDNLMTE